ncbi:MAG: DUF3473 domain-containing protein [Alphaproteobacteria bacterium]|nr:MAG: DUF3473 domain-containing protein [Alphaproteobacteria bacterium]
MRADVQRVLAETTPAKLPDQFGSRHAFSIDVEEWFQVGAFEHTLKRDDWPVLESRVEHQTYGMLALLEEAGIKATFFCLGWVAERKPLLLHAIYEAGHEVGCHGQDHQRLFTMDRSQFVHDVFGSKKRIEDAIGASVFGYRAPSFSLTPDVWWVYDCLAEAGFTYSSSVYPVRHDHYGLPAAPRVPFWPTQDRSVLEVPMTVCKTFGRALPASGGGYFRLLPYGLARWLMGTAARQTGVPTIFYMHPWESDPGQPFVAEAPWLSRFRHYTGQRALAGKLRRLYRDFDWGRLDETVVWPVLRAEGRLP